MAQFLAVYPVSVWLVLLATGVLIGLLAGLLGVGGGVIAVPVLLDLYPAIGVPESGTLALAIGTAQASIVIASLAATYAHWKAGTIDKTLVRAWMPALTIGTLAGLSLAPFTPAGVLTAAFAVVATGLALKMALGPHYVLSHRQPTGPAAQVAPALVGSLSAAVAVGAGTLSTPVLALFSFPLHRAIGAGARFNLVVSVPAAVACLFSGWGVAGRPPDAVGDVAMFCVAALSLPALFVAPFAAGWSTRAPLPLLRRLFAAILGLIALRLLLKL